MRSQNGLFSFLSCISCTRMHYEIRIFVNADYHIPTINFLFSSSTACVCAHNEHEFNYYLCIYGNRICVYICKKIMCWPYRKTNNNFPFFSSSSSKKQIRKRTKRKNSSSSSDDDDHLNFER